MDSDDRLARRAAQGDSAAFGALVRAHEGRVRRFIARLVCGEGADDIAQDVFVKAWRMRAQWRDDGRYGAWLMGIAWTSFLDFRRVQARHARGDALGLDREGPQTQAEEAIDVARAMAGLDERTRAAAQLCLGEGYSHSEAADILQMPLGTLKSIVARARVQLALALEKNHGR